MGSAAATQARGPPTNEQLDALRKTWPVGSICAITGLQSGAAQHLNGKLGEVRALDEATGRMCLRLHPKDGVSKWKKVRPLNMRNAMIEAVL